MEEMELTGNINVNFTYLDDFEANPDHQTKATAWFTDGTEVIFAAAGGAGTSVMNAANALTDKFVIGVDVDQSGKSDTVITSAKKELKNAVYQNLTAIYDEDSSVFKAGETTILDATNDGIGLPSDFSRFNTFTSADYDAIFAALKANTDSIRTNISSNISAKGEDETQKDATQRDIDALGLVKVSVELS